MTDGGLIEGSAPAGDSGAEYTTVLDAADTGTALVYGDETGAAEADGAGYADYSGYGETAYDETAFYTEPTASSEIAFGDTGTGGRSGCTAGACPHPVEHPAEADWERLVSAVPVEGQLGRFKPRCEGMSYPTEDDFRSAVAAVRPLDPDSFSLQRLRTGWNEEVAAVLADWPGLMRSALAALAAGWAGADFDAFCEQADQAKALVQGVLDDIEDTAAELKHREEALYTLQGGDSGEIPYPAPLVGADGEWTSLVAIHVRPAWWHGDCIRMGCEEAGDALRLGGADPALAAEVRAFLEERAGDAVEGSVAGVALSEARLQAGEEARTAFGARIDAEAAAYAERHAAIDGAIGEKLDGQSEQLAAMRATGADRPCPDTADSSYMDLASPVMEQPAAPVAPQATQDPSPVPPSGDGSVRTEDETASAPSEATADGTVSGGLASGGGGGFGGFGGGPGGGGVVPGGAATVAGGAGFTGTAPGVFGPGAATGPAAAGSGSGPGVGAARTSAASGQAAADARKKGERSEEDEEPEDDDLLFRETGNVWGYVRPGDDPYS
ncbi:hypothetical protein ACFQQE_06490 [Glycomyces mayteni]|uniref:hypothetical protein n=1 Tax=Glycomyces mayteni TaxID=543887 RepID=UPI00361C0024|nr:hypothetical protein GCM10025732_10370 [Glycomyces mayteni]